MIDFAIHSTNRPHPREPLSNPVDVADVARMSETKFINTTLEGRWNRYITQLLILCPLSFLLNTGVIWCIIHVCRQHFGP